ncbi:MAG: hypothetical protein E6J56_25330, partial [Deltaproteobacteria bacterium]
MTCRKSQQQIVLESRQPESFMIEEDAREQASGLAPARHRQEGGSTGTRPRTNRITLRVPCPDTPRSSSLATTGDSRTRRLPMVARMSGSDRIPRSTSIWTLVSKKAIIDLAGSNRSSGLPQDGVRAQPLLFFGQQRV